MTAMTRALAITYALALLALGGCASPAASDCDAGWSPMSGRGATCGDDLGAHP